MISESPGRSAASRLCVVHRRADEAAHVLHRDMVHGVSTASLSRSKPMTSNSDSVDHPPLSRWAGQYSPRQRRHAKRHRPAIGLEAAPGTRDPFGKVAHVARVERIDRIEALGRVARRQAHQPGAVIVDGRRRPGAKACRLVATHGRQIRQAVRARPRPPSASVVAVDGDIFLGQVAGPDRRLAAADAEVGDDADLVAASCRPRSPPPNRPDRARPCARDGCRRTRSTGGRGPPVRRPCRPPSPRGPNWRPRRPPRS